MESKRSTDKIQKKHKLTSENNIKHTQKKTRIVERTERAWFSHLLRHSVRIWIRSILSCPEPEPPKTIEGRISLSILTAWTWVSWFIGTKDDGGDRDNWSYKKCKAQVKSSQPTNQTRNSAITDKPARRVYRSVKATKHSTIPYVRYSFLLCYSNFVFKMRHFTIFDFREIRVRGHSRSPTWMCAPFLQCLRQLSLLVDLKGWDYGIQTEIRAPFYRFKPIEWYHFQWQWSLSMTSVIESGTILQIWCGFLLVFYRNSVRKMHGIWDTRLQKCRNLENRVRGPSRSLEMSPCDRAHMTSYWRSIVTMALSRVVSEIFSVEKCRDLEMGIKCHSKSLRVVSFDRLCMVSY